MATNTERNQEENIAMLSDQTSEISRTVLAIERDDMRFLRYAYRERAEESARSKRRECKPGD